MQPTWGLISDIDDTIIQTHSGSLFHLIIHTFFTHPKNVEGMPQLFTHIRVMFANPCFWYISASPYNLLPYFRSPPNIRAYPPGEIILPLRRTALRLMLPIRSGIQNYKVSCIERIYSRSPPKKVICLGDSQQLDPEVYGEIFRRYPHWICAIFIRITGPRRYYNDLERYRRAFLDVPRDIWHTFHHPTELYEKIDRLEEGS
jgi:phosphatidate phosphatase APP1